jgi:hypothetical protein
MPCCPGLDHNRRFLTELIAEQLPLVTMIRR